MPTKLVKISERCFKGCSSLSGVILPHGTKYIGLDAFADCSSLERIALPVGLSYIEDVDAFGGCTSLSEISFGGDSEAWENITRGKVISVRREDMTVHVPKLTFMNLKK